MSPTPHQRRIGKATAIAGGLLGITGILMNYQADKNYQAVPEVAAVHTIDQKLRHINTPHSTIDSYGHVRIYGHESNEELKHKWTDIQSYHQEFNMLHAKRDSLKATTAYQEAEQENFNKKLLTAIPFVVGIGLSLFAGEYLMRKEEES